MFFFCALFSQNQVLGKKATFHLNGKLITNTSEFELPKNTTYAPEPLENEDPAESLENNFVAESEKLPIDGPLSTNIKNFFYNLFGYAKTEDSQILDAGDVKIGFSTELINENESVNLLITEQGLPLKSSVFKFEEGRKDAYFVDYELIENNYSFRVGLGWGFEFGVDVTEIDMSTDHADKFIDEYHKSLGFSRGKRFTGQEGRNIIEFYRYNEETELIETFDHTDDLNGISKVLVSIAKDIYSEGDFYSALRIFYKNPMGDKDKLFSSGSSDIYTSLSFKKRRWFVDSLALNMWLGFLNAGKINDPTLSEIQFSSAYDVHTSVTYLPYSNFGYKFLISYYSNLYESDTNLLGEAMIVSGLGIVGRIFDTNRIELMITEDADVYAGAPDVLIGLKLESKF